MKPTCAIRLDSHSLGIDSAECTGIQIAAVVREINSMVTDCVWFGSDVEEQIDGPEITGLIGAKVPVLIGNAEVAVTFFKTVAQFVWGVFLGVPGGNIPAQWQEIYTEDEMFRDIGGAVVEIRAFDTAYLLIFAVEIRHIEALHKKYGGEIILPKNISV